MADKEKIRAEIERLYKDNDNVGKMCYNQALQDIQTFIDSLSEESVSKDLEEEIIKIRKHHFINDDWDKREFDGINISNMLRHIAKWQREQLMKQCLPADVN